MSKPYIWQVLATYNSERARGIVHTKEWDEKMRVEQTAFNDERAEEMLAQGWVRVPGGWVQPTGDSPIE